MAQNSEEETAGSLVPSEKLMTEQYIGHTTKELFITKGDELFELFREHGSLTTDAKVLDVGCGLGRLARPFTQYLSENGEYWGLDVSKKSIDWCKKQYGGHYPNFNFVFIDFHNKSYNPDGTKKASSFRFPFDDNSFDFVFLLSVFTHMYLDDIENYMQEVVRILKPGKKCIITWFLLNDKSLANLHAGNSREDFKYDIPGGLTKSKDTPELATAYQEEVALKLYESAGLVIQEPIRYGLWSGRKDFFRYQEFVFAQKAR